MELKGASGRKWGVALKGPQCKSPIFVSIGNLCDLDTAVRLVQACSKFKIPEPVILL